MAIKHNTLLDQSNYDFSENIGNSLHKIALGQGLTKEVASVIDGLLDSSSVDEDSVEWTMLKSLATEASALSVAELVLKVATQAKTDAELQSITMLCAMQSNVMIQLIFAAYALGRQNRI